MTPGLFERTTTSQDAGPMDGAHFFLSRGLAAAACTGRAASRDDEIRERMDGQAVVQCGRWSGRPAIGLGEGGPESLREGR